MRTFSLDMIPGGAQTAVACNQYEVGDTWVFALYYDGGRYEIPTGADVSITGTKPDGAAYKIAGTVESNAVQIVVTDQITACAGRSIAEILVESETDGTVLYSANFPLLIEPAAVQGELSPSEIPSAIVDEDGNVYYESKSILGLYPVESASGDIAVIHDGADNLPVRDLSVAIEPVQTGTGTPSPSNVRAISGWDAVKVMRTGNNLLPPADEYENHTIDLPTTVYGGTLDVTKGILTVDKGFVTWNGSEDWVLSGGKKARGNIYALQNIIKKPTAATEVLEGLQASYLTAQTDNATYQGTVGISCQTNGVVGITLTGEATTVDATKAYLAEHPLQVVYPLATPITYTLTPTEVKTLLGENRIYADAGQVMVQYRADFNEAGLMYIPKAPTADGSYRLTADVTGGTPTYRWEAE